MTYAEVWLSTYNAALPVTISRALERPDALIAASRQAGVSFDVMVTTVAAECADASLAQFKKRFVADEGKDAYR